MTEPQLGGTYDELLEIATYAERSGLASFTRSDHYYSGQDPKPPATDAFATLAGLARETERIKLTVLVSPITFRHPAVIAKNAVTIDQMSGGRLELGVGTGWMDLEHEAYGMPFPPWKERFERLEEALQYLKAAFADDPSHFRGDYYSLDGEIYPKPTSEIPIIVGGSGPVKTPRLAGIYADEYNHFVSTLDELSPKLERVRRAAQSAGRDPDSIKVSMSGPVVVAPDEASYRHVLAKRAADRDVEVDAYEERLAGIGVPMGPPERVGERMAALEKFGVGRYYLQYFHLDLDEMKNDVEVMTAL